LRLPFVYEYVNNKWVHMVDFILQKKPGKYEIHLIQIIGKMSAAFNTTMKHFSKLAASNYEKTGPSNKEWGGRNNRSSTDTAMTNY
jgi:hypothetical protein